MAQSLSSPQRYRGFVLTDAGLQKLHDRLKKLETQTRLRQSPRSIAERVQLQDPDGIHSITVRKILDGQHGVDRRSIQLVFQVLQISLEEGDYAHAGLCHQAAELALEVASETASETASEATSGASTEENLSGHPDWREASDKADLYGRKNELAQLSQAIGSEHCRIVQILGMAGVGKTALASALTRTIQPEFEMVIWKSLHHAPAIQTVLTRILQGLLQQAPKSVDLPTHLEALAGLLIEQLQNHRCLIVLDHFDSILCSKQYAGYCRQGYEAYREFLQVLVEVPHQSCLIITSREKPRAVGIVERSSRSLQLNGLSVSECLQMFSGDRELTGTTEDWQSLIQHCDGNPLMLKIVKVYIQNYFNSSISNYLKYLKPGKLLLSDLRDLLKQQFDRLSPLEQALVYHLARYQKPISISQFREDIASSISHHYWLEGLDSLERRSLLHRQEACFALDPMMRIYVEENLIEQHDDFPSKLKLEIVPNSHTVA